MTRYSLILFTVVLLVSLTSYGQEDYTQWSHSSDIIINTSASGYNIISNLNNFPFLVRLNSSDFDFSQAKTNGEDIRFANSSGTHLSYQIEEWSSSGGAASIWVKVDAIQGDNSTQSIKMHWGKSDATDQSSASAVFGTADDFVGVWHLSSLSDATTNDLSLTNNDCSALASSIIGGGYTLPGTANTSLSRAHNSVFNITSAITLSVWIKPVDANLDQKVMGKSTWPPAGYLLALNMGIDAELWDVNGTDYRPSGGIIESGRWTHIAVTWETGGQVISYINGVATTEVDASSDDLGTNSDPFYFGRCGWDAGTMLFLGDIDEGRLEKTVRSADWLKLCYFNQKEVAYAPPTINYTPKDYNFAYNSVVTITPEVTGIIDSITVTPSLPMGLFFNAQTGAITGNTMDMLQSNTHFITAYNEIGTDADTITITVSPNASVRTGSMNLRPGFLGFMGNDPSKIYFSLALVKHIRELRFALYDLTGTTVWSSRLGGGELKPGSQSIGIDKRQKLVPGTYLLEMKTTGCGTYTFPARRIKTVIVK